MEGRLEGLAPWEKQPKVALFLLLAAPQGLSANSDQTRGLYSSSKAPPESCSQTASAHTQSASKSVCVEPLPSARRCAHAHAQLLLIHPCDASAQTQVDEIISSFCRREVGFYSLYSTFSLEYEISLFLYVEGQISAWPRGKHSHGGRIGELRHVQTIILGVDLEVLQARNENWSAGMLPRVSWGIRSGSVHTYKNGIFPQ